MPEFVGRSAETAALAALIDQAASGAARSVFVRGAAGSGKTTLLERSIAEARDRGFRVVELPVRGDGVTLSALRSVLAEPGRPDTRRLAAGLEDGASATPDERIAEVADAVRELVEHWALDQPVLLAIDDFDAADLATVGAVLYLVRHVRHHRVLVVATCCDEQVGVELAEHIRRLVDGQRAAEVVLGPFGHDDLADLVRVRTGVAAHDDFVALLQSQSGGLPFFAVLLLDVLIGAGVDPASALLPARAADLTLPRRVTTAVLGRVFALGADARLVAAAVSVLGVLSLRRLPLLGELTGLAAARTNDAFDRLVRAEILVGDGDSYRFAHSIVRDSLYADLDRAVRRAWHARAAMALAASLSADRPDEILEIAGHLRRGTGGRDDTAAELLREAGEAVLYDDPGAAAAWYEESLARLGPDSPAAAAVQLSLGQALELGGRHERAARVTAAALRRLPPGADRERGAAIAAQAALAAGRFELAATFLDAALDDATGSGGLLLQRGWVHFWQGRLAAAARDLADARAGGVGDGAALADALEMHLALERGESRRGAAIAERLRARLDDLPAAVRSNVRVAVRVADAFDLDPAPAVADAATTDARSAMAAWHHSFTAYAFWRRGRLDEALRTVELAAAVVGDERADLASSVVLAVQIWVRTERGDLAGAEAVHQLARASQLLVMPFLVECAVARLHRARGEHDVALAVVDAAIRRESGIGRANVLSMCLAELVECAAAGRVDQARAANSRLQALPDDGCSVATTMWRTLSQAISERDSGAARAARDHAVRHGLAIDAARALALIGELDGDHESIAAARDELAGLGAVTRQAEVDGLLRRRGGRKPSRRAPRQLLSTDEITIAQLVAEGLTNRQIAQRVSLSPKTIEVYLSRIYAKTGYRSRVELAVAVQRDELPRPGPTSVDEADDGGLDG